MLDLLKKIGKSILTIEKTGRTQSKEQLKEIVQESINVSSYNDPSNVNIDEEKVKKFKKIFLENINKKRTKTIGINEFLTTKNAIISISDEKTKYTAVFEMLKLQGLTKESLLNSCYELIELSKVENDEFLEIIRQLYPDLIEKGQKRVKEVDAEIGTLRQTLKLLQDKKLKLIQEIEINKQKIETNTNSAYSAMASIVIDLEKEIDLIKNL